MAGDDDKVTPDGLRCSTISADQILPGDAELRPEDVAPLVTVGMSRKGFQVRVGDATVEQRTSWSGRPIVSSHITVGDHDIYEIAVAAALFGMGAREGALGPRTGARTIQQAQALTRRFESAARAAERDGLDPEGFSGVHQGECDEIRAEIEEALVKTPSLNLRSTREAAHMVAEFEDSIFSIAELRQQKALAAATGGTLSHTWDHDIVSADHDAALCRDELLEALSHDPDFRGLFLESQREAEKWGHIASSWEQTGREVGAAHPHELRNAVESLRGEALAADQRAGECAAYALELRRHLLEVRTNDLDSGLEMIHHAVMASPRSADSERLSHSVLDAATDKRFGEILSSNLAHTDKISSALRQAVAEKTGLEAEVVNLRALLGENYEDLASELQLEQARGRERSTLIKLLAGLWVFNLLFMLARLF